MELSDRGQELYQILSKLSDGVLLTELVNQCEIARESTARQEAIAKVLGERALNE